MSSLRLVSRSTPRRFFSTSQAAAAAKRRPQPPTPPPPPSSSSSSSSSSQWIPRRTTLAILGVGGFVGGTTYGILDGLEEGALSSALRAYIVYSACSVPWVIDHAPGVLDVLLSIPIASSITEAIIRHTFFAQVRSMTVLYVGAFNIFVLFFYP
jgi:hypothetical protein